MATIGVVLAGGRGARLLPLSRVRPKPFLRLAGKMLYEYALAELRYAGLRDVVVVTRSEWASLVKGAGVAVQEEPGLDGAFRAAVRAAESRGAENVVLVFAGFLSNPPGLVAGLLEYYRSSGYPLVTAVAPVVSGLETYGFVSLSPDGRVESMKQPFDVVAEAPEKPGYVFAGVLAASTRSLSSYNGFIEAVNGLASQGLAGAYVWPGEWVEIGYPWDLLQAAEIALEALQPIHSPRATVARGAVIVGRVVVEDGAFIGEGAIIEGPAFIGRGARVMPGAVVKGPAIIDEGSTVGSNSVVEESVVMDGVLVEPLSVVQRSVIGHGARIGAVSALRASKPTRLPERLKGLVELLPEEVLLGAIVAPHAEVPPRSTLSGGVIVE